MLLLVMDGQACGVEGPPLPPGSLTAWLATTDMGQTTVLGNTEDQELETRAGDFSRLGPYGRRLARNQHQDRRQPEQSEQPRSERTCNTRVAQNHCQNANQLLER